MPRQSGVVRPGSALERKGWVKEGLIQKKSESFWSPYIGTSASAVVYQKNMESAKEGNNITFDFDGNYAAEAFTGRETAYGKAGSKAKFSDKLTIDVVMFTIGNGRKFDGKNIDDLKINEHSNSLGLLADNWTRAKDQSFFNVAQGYTIGSAPTHIITPSGKVGRSATETGANKLVEAEDKWTFKFLQDLEEKLSTGEGFSKGSKRRPLSPVNGKFIVMIDSAAHLQLMQDPAFQRIVQSADVRGQDNMLLKNVITTFGSLVLIKMPNYFGTSTSRKLYKDKVEISGAKRISINSATKFAWQGTADYDSSKQVNARSFVIGANALKFGMGKAPDYMLQLSQDFGRTSESGMEMYLGVDKTQLVAENEDYDDAKVSGFDFGIIAIDSFVKA